MPPVIEALLEETGVKPGEVQHFILPCTLPRVAQTSRAWADSACF